MAATLVVEVPPAVSKFLLSIALLRREELSLRPLSPEESAKDSAALRATTVLAEGLGAFVLVDPGSSNAYCYVSRGLQAGAVFQFDHDGGIEFAFPSLAAFASALRKAVKGGVDLEELPHAEARPLDKQVALAARIVAWATDTSLGRIATDAERDALREREAKVASHLPRLDPDDLETLRVVVTSTNFLLRESAALFLVAHARRAYLPLARLLAVDDYPQVWRPARKVFTVLGAKPPAWTPAQEDEIVGDARGTMGLVFTRVVRANGKTRLTCDDAERSGGRSPYKWQPAGDAFRFDFTPAELEEARSAATPDARLAALGSFVAGRLALLESKGRRGRPGKAR